MSSKSSSPRTSLPKSALGSPSRIESRNIELSFLLIDFFCDKGWRSENEAQLRYIGELFFQLLKGINRKTRRSNRKTATLAKRGEHILFQCLIYVVYYFHIKKKNKTPT